MGRLIRMAGLVGLAALVVGGPALAQADLRLLRERNVILQQQDIARQNAMAARQEADAAQSRYDTQLTLRSLSEAASPPTQPSLRPALGPIPPRGPRADDVSRGDLAADMARMDALVDARLAQSNARLRELVR